MRHMGQGKEATYREGILAAARQGAEILSNEGTAIDACVAAVRLMEASGAFNAGAGAGLTVDGLVEVDAAVMRGRDASIGAVAAVPGIANPVEIAELVRTNSPNCLLAGPGVISFANEHNLALVRCEPAPEKLEKYRRMIANDNDDRPLSAEDLTRFGGTHDEGDTVGAMALDRNGEMACAVSTGGLWLKVPGRVGDTPLPGPGFWIEDGVGAAIATGTGEFIIRGMMSAKAVEAMGRGMSAAEAARHACDLITAAFGAEKAGIATLDCHGRLGFAFNTRGMGRAVIRDGMDKPATGVWPGDEP